MHIRDYVISYGKKVKKPDMPDEADFVDVVKADWCKIEDLPKEELKEEIINFLNNVLGGGVVGKIMKDGVVKVSIPKGKIRKFLRARIREIKKAAMGLGEDNYIKAMHKIHRLTDYINPFDQVFVEIYDEFIDYDPCHRSLIYVVDDNDKKDTTMYVYGSIQHHA